MRTVHYPEIIEVSPTERDTIVAALRYWQRTGIEQRHRNPEFEIATHRAAPLSPAEIDTLCRRIRSQGLSPA
ncbi:MAG: hypothetical protein CTY25_12000 [Methylobacterium sp.]|nr:MAG: hypothetical protein CTY25_12000 [Methylobacterium sp.]